MTAVRSYLSFLTTWYQWAVWYDGAYPGYHLQTILQVVDEWNNDQSFEDIGWHVFSIFRIKGCNGNNTAKGLKSFLCLTHLSLLSLRHPDHQSLIHVNPSTPSKPLSKVAVFTTPLRVLHCFPSVVVAVLGTGCGLESALMLKNGRQAFL